LRALDLFVPKPIINRHNCTGHTFLASQLIPRKLPPTEGIYKLDTLRADLDGTTLLCTICLEIAYDASCFV